MSKKRVAIIGAGAVGASTAYYLSKKKDLELTVFDEGVGQGTAAAAGIVSPWLSRRRNKKWYRMVKKGAAFYPIFLSEVMKDKPIPSSVYRKVGTLLFKKKYDHLEEMLEVGLKRRETAPEIGELAILSPDEIREKNPLYTGNKSAIWVAGGARVDGEKLVKLLLNTAQDQGMKFINEKARLSKQAEERYAIKTKSVEETYDSVILANAAWLPESLEPLGYKVDIRPQKGQLVEIALDNVSTKNWPVVMPAGEKDIIPFGDGRIFIGATHENEAGFDLSIDKSLLQPMIEESITEFSSHFKDARISHYRSGTRAFTSDYSPFFGEVPHANQLFTASGFGSTGLTSGPLVGKILAQLVLNQTPDLNPDDYPIAKYIEKKEY